MKLFAALAYASISLQVFAASPQASVYIFDRARHQSNQEPPSLSPITARLLLAERLGLTRYHSLGSADERTLEILNKYGGSQEQLFIDEDRVKNIQKFLLFVEGVERPNGIFTYS